MTSDKKSRRVKYMRLLEKFFRSSSIVLRLENFNYNLFEKRARKLEKLIREVDEIRLDSSYFKSLLNFTQLTMQTLDNRELKTDEKRDLLLKEVNLIDKNRNKRVYKKSKHKKIEY